VDITQIQDIAGWLIGIFATSVVTGIIGVISIIRAGKMLPKDLRNADLDNREKEIDIADKYEILAEKAAQKAIQLQDRLDKYENVQLQLKTDQNDLKNKVDNQEIIIEKQASIIEKQAEKLDAQEVQIKGLICEINNYKIYTTELIQQLKNANVVPVDMDSLDLEDCNGKSPSKRKKK